MSTNTRRHGFVAAQPAAAISALDFAARLSAYQAARDADAAIDAEEDAISLPVHQAMVDAQSALIATPVRKLDLIAAKVNALYHRFGGDQGGDLSNPTTQTVIMGLNPRPLTEDDASQCLLSVYLDLTAAAQDRAAWDAAVQAVETAWAEVEAINARERATDEDCSDEWNEAWGRHSDALEALLTTRAPDAAAMGLKARLTIEKHMCEDVDDDPDNPDTLSRLMGDGSWSEHAMAALYQDALALAGVSSPAALAQPERFDGVAWYQEAEATFGVRFATEERKPTGLTAEGRDVSGALAAFAALPAWKRGEAWSSVLSREHATKQEAERAAAEARGPTPPAELRALFLRGLLNTHEDAGEREAIRADLASIGLAIYLDPMATGDGSDAAPPPFDPAAFLTDLLAADLSVIVEPRGSVSELYFNADKPRHANADAMAARFDDLTGHDRRALAAYILSLSK